jgi:hypothetical protein
MGIAGGLLIIFIAGVFWCALPCFHVALWCLTLNNRM